MTGSPISPRNLVRHNACSLDNAAVHSLRCLHHFLALPSTREVLMRGSVLLSSMIALGVPWFGGYASAQSRPPNIVVIVTDDMGYADIGVHGSKDIPTPNIDALANTGIRFTDAYVSGPYCSPTRAGLLTGRYPQRFGHEFNPGGGNEPDLGLPPSEVTLADRLEAAGYRTALVGKWHLGFADRLHPMERGFDEFFGFLGGGHAYFQVPATGANSILDGRTRVSEPAYLTDAFADRAVDFIQRHRAQPFFLYLAFNAVHTPMHAAEKYLARFQHIADPNRRTYAAMLAAMDDAIGRTLDALRAGDLEEKTLIILFNDNGGPTMATTSVNGSSNAPLRGSKRQTLEGGIRVPFIIRWKGQLPAGKVDNRPIIQLDVLPTALAAAGVDVKPEWKLDGVNLLPYLTGAVSAEPHAALYWRLGEHMAIRSGAWKLVKSGEGRLRDVDHNAPRDLSTAALYNLKDDIGEQHDLAAKHPEKVRELTEAWQKWNRELAQPLWSPREPPRGVIGSR
jgi:arylsulfatase A-like enzyme